jgi:hypothetical protein
MRVTCSSSGSRFSMYALRQLVASYFENASAFRHISRKWRSYFSISGMYAVRARALREPRQRSTIPWGQEERGE